MPTDSVYYSEATGLAHRVSAMARNRVYDLFAREMTPGPDTTILDIGGSDVETLEANTLEKRHPWPENITCGVVGDVAAMQASYPLISVARIPAGGRLPFADGQFDIAYANAVLEHVGPAEKRRAFILEAMRVARAVFIAVPNRWFPIEHHTGIPLLHYLPGLFRDWMRGGARDYWSRADNLDFLSRGQLAREWPAAGDANLRYAGLPLGPFSSNLIAFSASRPQKHFQAPPCRNAVVPAPAPQAPLAASDT